jgi:hypothetical protein
MTLDALVPNAATRLAPYGYGEYDAMPAMWLEGTPGDSPAGARDLWITQVTSPVPLAAFRRILSLVFHLSLAEVNLVLGEKTLAIPHVRHYLGWLDNIPVSTASIVLSGDVAGVWNVGTLADYRHRGWLQLSCAISSLTLARWAATKVCCWPPTMAGPSTSA